LDNSTKTTIQPVWVNESLFSRGPFSGSVYNPELILTDVQPSREVSFLKNKSALDLQGYLGRRRYEPGS